MKIEQQMTDKCTVLVNSCDAYEDTWAPFFTLLRDYWQSLPFPVVLNTESKDFSFPGFSIQTFHLCKRGAKMPWGKRLIETLKRIDTEYILFMLDDFFLTAPVDQKRIEECISWMDADSSIAVFSFWRTHQPNIQDEMYPHFERRPQNGEYRLNCQAGIWRREKLLSYIRPHESPWEWEILGSERSSRYREKFYSAIEGEPYIMQYDWFAGGGIHRGKWSYNVPKLLEDHGLAIDYSIRGFYKKEEPADKMDKSIVAKALHRVVSRLDQKWRRYLSLR